MTTLQCAERVPHASTRALLELAERALSCPTKWCAEVAALKGRVECDPRDPTATRRCLVGAVEYAARSLPVARRDGAVEAVLVWLGYTLTGAFLSPDNAGDKVRRWHDRRGRRYGEVIALLHRAREMAMGFGSSS